MIASKAFYRHDFPAPHTDSVESVIDYRVPPDKFTALAEFDGGVIAERTAISRLASTALAFQRVVVIARRWIFGARIARPDDHRFRYNTFHSDRKSVVLGKSGSVRLDLGGRRIIKKKNKK